MAKYFVMRECENIPTGISLCCDSAFAHKKEFSIFKFPKRFLEITSRDLTSFTNPLDFMLSIPTLDIAHALSSIF